MNIFKAILSTIFLSLLLAACGGSHKNDPNHIRVGVTSGPEKDLAETAKLVAKEQYGLDVELIPFNDYVLPNEAISTKDLDVNVFQHAPYLEEQTKQHGYKLAIVGKTFVYPMVAYSKKIKGIAELQDGSTIAIPNDPTNGGRALLLLEKSELLKLRDNAGLLPTVNDIVENPRQLNIVEIEAPQLPRIIDDKKITIAIINNNFAAQAGLDPNEYGILAEDKDSPYVNIIVSREENRDEEKIRNFVKAYQSEAVEATAKNVFKGYAIKGW